MRQQITMFDLLLSCPDDAYKECYSSVNNAINEFNKEAQKNTLLIGVSLKHWSTDSFPQSGGEAQELLNSQIVDTSELAIAIFWTRFGTPTDKYGSGTEEEIDRFIKAKKQVFLYFFDKPLPPSMTDSQDYIENRKKIGELKEKYNGIYHVVKNKAELKKEIKGHLNEYFHSCNTKTPKINNKDMGRKVYPNDLLKLGNTTAQIDGDVARVEFRKPDGSTIYAEINGKKGEVKNIVADGFPQEYIVNIPENLIIRKQDNIISIHGIKYRVETYVLKFSGAAHVVYDIVSNKIQDMRIEAPAGMKVFLDSTNKKVYFIDDGIWNLSD